MSLPVISACLCESSKPADMHAQILQQQHRSFMHAMCVGLIARLCPQSVRQKLYDELTKINQERDWSFILRQIGGALVFFALPRLVIHNDCMLSLHMCADHANPRVMASAVIIAVQCTPALQ